MNPIPHPVRAFTLMGIGCFLMVVSFLSPILFFMKKIYYRGDVTIGTMNSSVRQAILLAVGVIFLGILSLYHISEGHILLVGITTLLCVEVMFQAIN